jgi:leucine dehydrogenase
MFSHPDFDNHEAVQLFSDPESGLQCIIAVHNTNRGPGAGGTRLWHYPDPADAVTDALRLSRAMSYKNAMAGLALGGGKGVILRPEGDFDRKALFAAYGRAVEAVGGRYITAEDVGVSPDDMRVIKTQTDFVAGLDEGKAASGDPSPVTAEGVFRSIRVAARYKMGLESLKGLRVAVQGLGHVGYGLCEHLHGAGCQLIVADINPDVLSLAQEAFGAIVVSPDQIHAQAVDIYAPCALGGAISAQTLPQIRASIIAGAANNQLATPDMGAALQTLGILYAPDYVVNAGGIINVASEVSGTYDRDWVSGKLDALEVTLLDVFKRAAEQGVPTGQIADMMARERMGLSAQPA